MSERFWNLLALRLPEKLVYWATIRLIVYATTGEYSNTVVPKLTAMNALSRWENKGKQNEMDK